jgi:hypothetical protein
MTGKPRDAQKALQNRKCFTEAFIEAHKLYDNPDAIIVKVAQPGDKNQFDQLFAIEELLSNG